MVKLEEMENFIGKMEIRTKVNLPKVYEMAREHSRVKNTTVFMRVIG